MEKPKAVVFDLGKVLLDFDYQRVVEKMLQHCRMAQGELLKVLNQSPLLFRYETGLMTTSEFFAEVKKASGFCRELGDFEPMFGDIFQPIPEMIELNASLRKAGLPTYIFSNTNDMAVKHIRRSYPFFQNFTAHVLSYEHGCMKPDARIYDIVEKITGERGPSLMYIDDRLENVEVGERHGWQVIHHQNTQQTIERVTAAFGLG
ncbi:MAG TPA: HAD family phosphatase [Verrucomicrobiae bacterium]|nr:HAD family phosphatase [Verrucomicrobiae bacterium]